jgi:NADH-quinone oxidoreductase subunit L
VRPLYALARVNRRDVVDQVYDGVAITLMWLHRLALKPQNGQLRWYAAAMAAGVIVLVGAARWT